MEARETRSASLGTDRIHHTVVPVGVGLPKQVIELLFNHRCHTADIELFAVVGVDNHRQRPREQKLAEIRPIEAADGAGLLEQDMRKRVHQLEDVLRDFPLDVVVGLGVKPAVSVDWIEVIQKE